MRIVLRGIGVGDALKTNPVAKLYKLNEDEIILDIPEKQVPTLGKSLNLNLKSDKYLYQSAYWLPDAPGTPVIYEIKSKKT